MSWVGHDHGGSCPQEQADEMANAQEVFAALLEEATLDLLDGYGISPTLSGHENSESLEIERSSLVSIIGFSGQAMRGSVCLKVPTQVALDTHPQKDPVPTSSELHDWAGELCNQLVGRAKNRLLRFGQTVGMGTPVVASSETGLSLVSAHTTRAAVFVCGEATCTVSCDVRTDGDLDLVELPPEEGEEPGLEGECFMF
ncbi:MAG: chemotaxis protein CheX [Nannocystaceae bacterium]|nr:chemotaxis protein CheX [Nannocystaceae bacterium]